MSSSPTSARILSSAVARTDLASLSSIAQRLRGAPEIEATARRRTARSNSHVTNAPSGLITRQYRANFRSTVGESPLSTVAWSGDANNVLASWVHAAARLDFTLNVAAPPEHSAPPALLAWAKNQGARINVTTDPFEAVAGAEAVVTDCWVSMGDDDDHHRHNLLGPYQVNAKLMAAAKKDAIFMHCLPAHRGEEVASEVIDSPCSVIYDEAENRLHVQKAIMYVLMTR